MARETGTVNEVFDISSGTILRDNGADPNPINYLDGTLPKRRIELSPGETVSYDVDTPDLATNISINVPVDPNVPPTQGTVISGDVSGNLSITQASTIDGAVITGSVTVNGATLVIKGGSIISGSVKLKGNASINLYDSTIGNNLSMEPSTGTLKVVKGTVKGNVEVQKVKGGTIKGSVKGNIEVSKMAELTIADLTVDGNLQVSGTTVSTVITNVSSTNGNITISGNTGCSYSNVTAPKGKVNISGCNPA